MATLHIVIAENLKGWRAIFRDVLKNEVFAGEEIEVYEAENAIEARAIIDELVANGECVFCLSDLHMDERGDRPELNGDSLVAGLIEDQVPVTFAIASGTISHNRARLLREGLDGPTFLCKDAFFIGADPADRALLAKRILHAAEYAQVTRVTLEQFEYLQRVVAEGMNVPGMHLLIDTIKSETSRILRDHLEELQAIGGYKILEVHGLYDGDPSLNVHEYKNELQFFIDCIRSSGGSEQLMIKLTLLQSLINNSYMSLRNNETSVEIVSMLESLCKKLSELSGKKIGFDTEVHKLHGSADPTTVHHILSNMLQNALAHGTGEIEVTVEINGCVRVWNKADREIGFTLIGGQLLDGELPTVSTTSTGSGTGLRSILEACNASRGALSFSMHNAKNGIVTELNLQEFSIPEQETDIATREPTVPFGMISFICHDNDPRSTFSKNEKICPAGHAFRYLDCPNSLLRGSGNMAEDLTRFIALNHAELSRTSLCVLHMNTLMIDALIEPLQELYPHITFLPASHEPAGLDTYLQRLAIKGRIPSHVLLPQVIEGSVQPNDAATEKQVRDSLFGVTFTRGVFETILAIAQRAAEKNAVTQK